MRLPPHARYTTLLFIGLSMAACVGLPHRQSVTDTRTLNVWPLDVCPSQPETANGSKSLIGVGGVLLGNLLSGLIGTQAAALSAAADADRNGFTVTGINARYYYGTARSGSMATLVPPGCYVVALARPVARAQVWCADASFSAALPVSCANGAARLDALRASEPLDEGTGSGFLAVPEFYAEIRLDPAGFGAAVRPALAVLYYPDSLLQHGSRAPRTLSLTIESASLQKSDPLRAADVAITVAGVVPAALQPEEVLQRAQTGWTGVPSFALQGGDPPPRPGHRYLPVTMQVSLHEVGDANAFLSAFARAFSASNGDYTQALTPP